MEKFEIKIITDAPKHLSIWANDFQFIRNWDENKKKPNKKWNAVSETPLTKTIRWKKNQ